MRLQTLMGNTRRSGIDLRDERGLIALVAADEADWREYMDVLHDAFGRAGDFPGPGPAVSGPKGPVRIGTPGFEALLAPLLAANGIRREEYAALWFGAGAVRVWLSAAGSLEQQRRRTRSQSGTGGELGRVAAADRSRAEENLRELEKRAAAAEAAAEAGILAWVREKQDAETRLSLYRDRERELRERVRQIEKDGEDAACSGCGRPLGDHAGAVCTVRREEWEVVVQDGRWWRRRRDQLQSRPRRVRQLEQRAAALRAEVAAMSATVVPEDAGAGTEVAAAARRSAGRAIHRKAVALTGGRIAGAFPGLFRDWMEGARGGAGGEEIAVLELATRIAMVELALECGTAPGSAVFSTGLEQLNSEDIPRVLGELADLARRVPLLVVKVTPQVAAAAPECFDLLLRLEHSPTGRRVRRQKSGLGLIRLR